VIERIATPSRKMKPRDPEDSLEEAPKSRTGGKEGTAEEEPQGNPPGRGSHAARRTWTQRQDAEKRKKVRSAPYRRPSDPNAGFSSF
jgi:hypothetical protein